MDTYRFRKDIHKLPGKVIHAVPLPEPEVTEGHQSREKIGEICLEKGFSQVLLVTDRTLSGLGYEKAIVASLERAGIGCTLFNDIHTEPTIAIIEAGKQKALACQAECIIALGGGSVLDSCKMIAASVKMPHLPVKVLLQKFLVVPGKTLPIIAVPSTAGTGAEITVGAVVMNESGVKGSTVLIGLDVAHVVLDSELTVHAPARVTAACGIDALSHCIEGAVSDVKVDEGDAEMSIEGIRLILRNLPIVMRAPENVEARLGMCRAAMCGGNAINTQLAGYVHAFAHSIGAKYHLPHGVAISLMLMPVLEFQKAVCLARYADIARRCSLTGEEASDEVAAESFLRAVRQLLAQCGMDKINSPVRECDYEELIPMVAADSINYSSPITMTNNEIKQVLETVTPAIAEEEGGFTENKIRAIVDAQRRFFRTGTTLPVKWRIQQLKKLKAAVLAHEAEFEEALAQDLGRSKVEAYITDIGPIIAEVNEMIHGLRRWARRSVISAG